MAKEFVKCVEDNGAEYQVGMKRFYKKIKILIHINYHNFT